MSFVSSGSFSLLVAPFFLPNLLGHVDAAPVTAHSRHSRAEVRSGTADEQPVIGHRHFHSGSSHHARAHKHRRLRKRQDSDSGPNNIKKSDRIMGTIDIVLPREDEDDPSWMAALHADCTADPCAFDITSREPTPVFLVNAPEDGFKFSATADGVIFKPVLLEIPSGRLKHQGKEKVGPQCVTYRIGNEKPTSSAMTIEPCVKSVEASQGGVNAKAADPVKSQIFAYHQKSRTIRPFWLAGIQSQDEAKPTPVDLDDRAVTPPPAQHVAMRFAPSASEALDTRQEVVAPDPEPVTSTITSTTTITLTEAVAPTPTPETPTEKADDAGDESSSAPVPATTSTADPIAPTDPTAAPAVLRRQVASSDVQPSSSTPATPSATPSSIPVAAPMNVTEVAENIASEATIQEELAEEGDEPVAANVSGTLDPVSPTTESSHAQSDKSRVEFPEGVAASKNEHSDGKAVGHGQTGKAEALADSGGEVITPLDTEPYVWKFEEFKGKIRW